MQKQGAMHMTDPQAPTTILIDATLDLSGATELHAALVESLSRPPTPSCIVELSDIRPTAPALQLAASLSKTLVTAAAFAGFGPNALTLLEA